MKSDLFIFLFMQLVLATSIKNGETLNIVIASIGIGAYLRIFWVAATEGINS